MVTVFLKSMKLLKCSVSTDIKMCTFTKLKKINYKTVLLLKFLDFPKNLTVMWETWVNPYIGKIPWERA